MEARVVSLPAKTISRKKLVNSASVSRSPSTSASMSLVTRSSAGSARRLSPSARAYSLMPWAAGLLNGSSRSSVVLP